VQPVDGEIKVAQRTLAAADIASEHWLPLVAGARL
jgi:hypothetical protein